MCLSVFVPRPATGEPEDHGMNCQDETESVEMPSQTGAEDEMPDSMVCSGAAGEEARAR